MLFKSLSSSPLQNVPLTKWSTCHKFRRCNFLLDACHSSATRDERLKTTTTTTQPPLLPYCACRKMAAADALQLWCPHPMFDGGECELPRRDLHVAQFTLPCQCHYVFPVVFPYQKHKNRHQDQHKPNDDASGSGSNGGVKGAIKYSRESTDRVRWHIRFENRTGPALNYRRCPC